MTELLHIAITGGSGFIGSNVVDALVAAGHRVTVLDVRPPHRGDVAYIPLDITDVDALTVAFDGVDVVFHLAAVSNINDAFEHPLETVAVNVSGTTNVWEAARRCGVRRAVLASTVWVYAGAIGPGPFDEDTPFHLPGAGHIYTSSKIAAEMVVHNYHELYGQPFTILRYGIPYGPRMREALVIPQFIRRALEGTPITINGDGTPVRSYLYASDLAVWLWTILLRGVSGRAYNVGSPRPVTLRELAE